MHARKQDPLTSHPSFPVIKKNQLGYFFPCSSSCLTSLSLNQNLKAEAIHEHQLVKAKGQGRKATSTLLPPSVFATLFSISA